MKKFDNIFDEMRYRFNKFDVHLDEISCHFDELKSRFDDLERRFHENMTDKWNFGTHAKDKKSKKKQEKK